MNNDLISREALKENGTVIAIVNGEKMKVVPVKFIDKAPTVEVPENAVNCVLTMFGNCSYNKTGCSDCEIKDKIRKALNKKPQTIGCFNCKHDYKRMSEEPCKYCNEKFCAWEAEGGRE